MIDIIAGWLVHTAPRDYPEYIKAPRAVNQGFTGLP
jgi:hypothetical protein